jgi:hypothetical protein
MRQRRVLLAAASVAIVLSPAAGVIVAPQTLLMAAPVPVAVTLLDAPTTVPAPPPMTTTVAVTTLVVKPARRAVQPVGDSHDDHNKPDTRPKPKPAGLPLGTPFVGKFDGPEIEGYARYEGQSTCDPLTKPGTLLMRDLLLARYPNTNSLGTSRACDVGGTSEHKEGRAFDWGADVSDAADRASVEDFVAALMASDAYGHPHALARRMGVMYLIWNQQIWNASHAEAGWQPYSGSSPHTDHMHISLSWAGARAETSFWSGHVVAGLPDGTRPTIPRRTTTTSRPDRPPRSTTTRPIRPPGSTTTTTRDDGVTTTTRRDA